MRIFSVLLVLLLATAVATPQVPAAQQVSGTVNEVMIGITFPTSNIVNEAQYSDPNKSEADLFDPYGGWMKVQTAAIAMAESANLLTIPGRMCSNGSVAPLNEEDWMGWVRDLRESGEAAYDAAKAESQETLIELSEQINGSCVNCHARYLDVGGDPTNRCNP